MSAAGQCQVWGVSPGILQHAGVFTECLAERAPLSTGCWCCPATVLSVCAELGQETLPHSSGSLYMVQSSEFHS